MSTSQLKDRLADYIPVNERLEQFYSGHPDGRVLTTVLEHNVEAGFILMRAEIYRNQDDVGPASTGHAFEDRSAGYVNKTSYIENCETSAVGRALALLGYEIKRGIASREEMQKVERMTTPLQVVEKPLSEKETLLKGVENACKLLNAAGEDPPFTKARLREWLKAEMGAASLEDLGTEEISELLRRLSLRLDARKHVEKDAEQLGPYCDCGIARVRREGKKNGKAWAAFMCANKVKEHSPVWIDLDAEHDRAMDRLGVTEEAFDDLEGGPF